VKRKRREIEMQGGGWKPFNMKVVREKTKTFEEGNKKKSTYIEVEL